MLVAAYTHTHQMKESLVDNTPVKTVKNKRQSRKKKRERKSHVYIHKPYIQYVFVLITHILHKQ